MKQEEDKFTGLPENAFRELKPGEVYNPLMGPSKNYPEVNIWSVAWGIAMAILFSAAAAYLGLKVGQVFEAAIPIAIIAVGVSELQKEKMRWEKMLLSNLSELVLVSLLPERSLPSPLFIFFKPNIPK